MKNEMPKILLDFLGYNFYFYSNENSEPIHVHVSKGKPSKNSVKFWIRENGIEIAYNHVNIPQNELNRIYKYICANKTIIIPRWYKYFGIPK